MYATGRDLILVRFQKALPGNYMRGERIVSPLSDTWILNPRFQALEKGLEIIVRSDLLEWTKLPEFVGVVGLQERIKDRL